MSFDSRTHEDRAFNVYWYSALVVAVVAGGALTYVAQKDFDTRALLWKDAASQTADIRRSLVFEEFACNYDSYNSDPMLRKVTNDIESLGQEYEPLDLDLIPRRLTHPLLGEMMARPEAVSAVVAMLDRAQAEGYNLRVNSAYRSAQTQADLYQHSTEVLLITNPERAAPSGHSEHQLGTAIDMSLYPSNGASGYQWLAENAHDYGFVLSYPEGAEDVTGYTYEPWHWRYVGIDIAKYVRDRGILFNHEQGLFLPSPTKEGEELPYEYLGNDLWVWKSLGDGNNLEALVSGVSIPDFVLDIRELLERFDEGMYVRGDTREVLPIREWIVEGPTNKYIDEFGGVWQRTSFASPFGGETVERIEILYRKDVGYVVVNYQNQEYTERIVREITNECGVGFGKSMNDIDVGVQEAVPERL